MADITPAKRPPIDVDDLRFLHLGRAWRGHEIEDACPCEQAPCGLVAFFTQGCEHHDPAFIKTMRQGHTAGNCPGGEV